MSGFLPECGCCTPGAPGGQLCQKCFMVWYDSGITSADVLAREARWRKSVGGWPWGDKPVTLDQLKALEAEPLPDLKAEQA